MTKLLSNALPLALASLLVAACTGDGTDGSGFAELAGTFDGVPVSSDDDGATASAEAILQGDDFLDVTITLRLPDDRYGAVIVVEDPISTPIGSTLAVGGADGVTATAFHDGDDPRAAGGTVRFDVLEAVVGGAVAGTFDLDFAGGNLSGSFDAVVE